jgi:GTP diphosphokinase / guanosine-3',5'-bis(diphosphate) 3'-diphosphatase
MNIIIKAAQLAKKLHEGQFRKYSGAPYISHTARVAGRMATHPIATEELVAAAFLHDVIEDCNVTDTELLESLSSVTAEWELDVRIRNTVYYVEWMTNKSLGSPLNRKKRKEMDAECLETAPKEVKVLKMLDRIDNLRELPPDDGFTAKYAEESLYLINCIGDADDDLKNEAIELINDILGVDEPA